MKNVIVFLGPPGCGKGTQGKKLAQAISDYQHVSIGDLLRTDALHNDNIKNILLEGGLLSDSIVNEVVDKTINNATGGLILDGYPRSLKQCHHLDHVLSINVTVLFFDINLDLIQNRIVNRISCIQCGTIYNSINFDSNNFQCSKCNSVNFTKREDDNSRALIKRLDEYKKYIVPISEYYEGKPNFYKVNANLSVDDLHNKIMSLVKID